MSGRRKRTAATPDGNARRQRPAATPSGDARRQRPMATPDGSESQRGDGRSTTVRAEGDILCVGSRGDSCGFGRRGGEGGKRVVSEQRPRAVRWHRGRLHRIRALCHARIEASQAADCELASELRVRRPLVILMQGGARHQPLRAATRTVGRYTRRPSIGRA